MKLDHYPIEHLKKQIREIVGKYYDLHACRLFFFGSRIDQTGTDRSDIDVGIEGPEEIPLDIITSIKEGLSQLPVLYKIDFVDFNGAEDNFREVALKHIELIE